MARKAETFYEAVKQLAIRVFTGVFFLKLALEDLLLEFNWEERLHLVRELLAVINVELLGREFGVAQGQLANFALQFDVARKQHEGTLDVGAVRRQDLVHPRNEVLFFKVESVALGHGQDCFLVLDPKSLNFLLDITLHSVEEVGSLSGGCLPVAEDDLSTLLPHVVPLQEGKPLDSTDESVGKPTEFVLVGLLAQVHLEVILANRAVDTPILRLLNIQLGFFLLVRRFYFLVHLVHAVGFLRIAGLVLNLGGGTWSLGLAGAHVLVVGQEPLESVVDHVLLLLKDAELVVDDSMHVVQVWGAHLRVGPSNEQFVLFVLQLRRSSHVELAEVLTHDRWIRPVSDHIQGLQVKLIGQQEEGFRLWQPTNFVDQILAVDLLLLWLVKEWHLRLEVIVFELLSDL